MTYLTNIQKFLKGRAFIYESFIFKEVDNICDYKILSVWMCLLTLKTLYEKEIKIMINFLLPSNSNYTKKKYSSY